MIQLEECKHYKICKNIQLLDSFTNIPTPVYVKNISARFIFFNDEFIKVFSKYQSDRLLGKTVSDMGYPKEKAEMYYHQDFSILSGLEKNQIIEDEIEIKNEIRKVKIYRTALEVSQKTHGIIGIIVLL